MRILIVHNYYQWRGGEDQVFESEASLLESYGHQVTRYSVHNDEVSEMGRLTLAAGTVWRRAAARELRSVMKDIGPDIVHFHNTFPLISPAAHHAASAQGLPVIQTLHNYRLLCAGANLFRRGSPCRDCVGKRFAWPAIAHACYRGSRATTAVVAAMQGSHRVLRTWQEKVTRFIALSNFAKSVFVEGGIPAAAISIKPNFVRGVPENGPISTNDQMALFVGRLSDEKGLDTLLQAWHTVSTPLQIIGEGPELERIRSQASGHVVFRGRLSASEVASAMRGAAFVVLPSRCYETFGLAAIEAFSVSRPVIASRLGALEEIVEDGVTGLHFTPGDPDDLAAKVGWATTHPEEMRRMGAAARQAYEEKYTPEENHRQLTGIYAEAISAAQRRGVLQGDGRPSGPIRTS